MNKNPNPGAQGQPSFISELPNVPAVYALYGGQGQRLYVAYVGIAEKLKPRVVQHLINRDSSVTTGTSPVRIDPDYVTQVGWWEHPIFEEVTFREAAELVAFDILKPVFRSRVAGTDRAKRVLESDGDFREEVASLFRGEPTGRLTTLPTLQNALIRLAEVERRLAALEQSIARND